MDGIGKTVKLAAEIGELQFLQNRDIGTKERQEKIESKTKETEDLYKAFQVTKPHQHTECYFELNNCYSRLWKFIHNENFDLRIFNRFKDDPIDDLEVLNNKLITMNTEIESLLFPDRVEGLHIGDLIMCHSQPRNDDKILRVRHIRGVRAGVNVTVENKNGDEMKLNKYQISCCHRIVRHGFQCNDDAMQKLDRGCLVERLHDITMSNFF